MNNKAIIIIEFGFRRIIMKNSAHLRGRIVLQNSSYPTQPHSIIAKYIINSNHEITCLSYP